jgi:hypothetical protein
VDQLAQKNSTFEELLALPVLGDGKVGLLVESLAFLTHTGQILPYVESPKADPEPALRFNRMIIDRARTGRAYANLASPIARTGVPVNEFGLLVLAAVQDGRAESAEMAAEYVFEQLRKSNRTPAKNGVPIQSNVDAVKHLIDVVRSPLEEGLPIWRRLGVI